MDLFIIIDFIIFMNFRSPNFKPYISLHLKTPLKLYSPICVF
jgi:hypothetical protein